MMGADQLQLKFSHDFVGTPLRQQDCSFFTEDGPFVGEEIGFIDRADFGQIVVENKWVVSCVPVVLDLEAYLIYDENQIYISHTVEEHSFSGNTWYVSFGWKLLD